MLDKIKPRENKQVHWETTVIRLSTRNELVFNAIIQRDHMMDFLLEFTRNLYVHGHVRCSHHAHISTEAFTLYVQAMQYAKYSNIHSAFCNEIWFVYWFERCESNVLVLECYGYKWNEWKLHDTKRAMTKNTHFITLFKNKIEPMQKHL